MLTTGNGHAPGCQHQAGERIEGYDNQGTVRDAQTHRSGKPAQAERVEGKEEERMSVVYGRKWVIKTQEDFDKAMDTLDYDAFVAEMSDSYARTCSEKQEIRQQMDDVIRQAKEAGLM